MRRQLFPILFACLTSPAFAASVTFTGLDGPALSPDANVSGGGTVNFWTVALTNPGNSSQNGSFISGGNWGLYANSGQQASANSLAFDSTALIANGPLDLGSESVSVTLDHGNIQNGGSIGVIFRDVGNVAVATFFFSGGDTEYRISDGAGSNFGTGVAFNSSPFTLSATMNNNTGGYTLTVNGTPFVRQLGFGITNINSIGVFNNNAGSGGAADYLFNTVTVTTIPEASGLILVGGGLLGLLARRLRLA